MSATDVRSTSAPGGRLVFSSTAAGPGRRSGWREIVSSLYAPLDIEIADEDRFNGRIAITSLPRISITDIETDGETAARHKSHISRDAGDFFFLSIGRYGSSSFSQYGRDCIVDAGQFTLLYSAAPYVFQHRERLRSTTVKVPASALERRLRDPHALCGIAGPNRLGLFRGVADLIDSVARDGCGLSADQSAIVEESLLDLIGVGLGPGEEPSPRGGTSAQWGIHRRAVSFMKENFERPDLTPDMIAEAVGVSTRYLHRAFENADESVCECLMDLRIGRSRSDLSDGGKLPMSIKEIAVRNGFKNQSHFSSLFRSRFGLTPREFRRSRR